MKENKKHSTSFWVDQDDAPEITSDLLSSGIKKVGERIVSDSEFYSAVKKSRVGRPALQNPKLLISMRYDADIIKYFKTTGKGWQTRMNDVLAKYVSSH